MDTLKHIAASDRTELEKMTEAFALITSQIIAQSQRELEILRAVQDEPAALKEQIKLSTIQHARSIYAQCHLLVTGRKAWNE